MDPSPLAYHLVKCHKTCIAPKVLLLLLGVLFQDAPGSPGEPNVMEVGGDFVSLSWEKPKTDGGDRIQGYIIEKKDAASDRWVNNFVTHS